MEYSREFLRLVLDSVTEHIAVIDQAGEIKFVNNTWSSFGRNNAGVTGNGWIGVNYLKECEKASNMGDDFGTQAGNGIRSVIEKQKDIFYFEYPCHSPDEKRWFMMRVTPFKFSDNKFFVISHQNITERKLAEEEISNLARIDGLTNIPNRRTFDEFLQQEWKRCKRLKMPICLALVDLDHFKLLNDDYGHQSGDECLIRIGKILKEFAQRPGDICARYGGEEFALLWGDTTLDQARSLANKLLKNIIKLNIQNINSPTEKYLTASIGIAETVPEINGDEGELINKADSMLYKAKKSGRNRVEY